MRLSFSLPFLLAAANELPPPNFQGAGLQLPEPSWAMLAELPLLSSSSSSSSTTTTTTVTTAAAASPATNSSAVAAKPSSGEVAPTTEEKPIQAHDHGATATNGTEAKTQTLMESIAQIVKKKVVEIAQDAEESGFMAGRGAQKIESNSRRGGGSHYLIIGVIAVAFASAAAAAYYIMFHKRGAEDESSGHTD